MQPAKTRKRVVADPGRGADEPVAKKPAPIAAHCLACKAKAKDRVEWADYAMKGATSTPVGNRCMSCHKLWQAAFAYLEWENYADVMKTEEDRRAINKTLPCNLDWPHLLVLFFHTRQYVSGKNCRICVLCSCDMCPMRLGKP
eukprot:6492258-Amphidinium_carterae.3